MCTVHVKGKGVSTCAMKTWENGGVNPLILKLLALIEGDRSAARPGRFTSRGLCSSIHVD
jgi:hypothetical protein